MRTETITGSAVSGKSKVVKNLQTGERYIVSNKTAAANAAANKKYLASQKPKTTVKKTSSTPKSTGTATSAPASAPTYQEDYSYDDGGGGYEGPSLAEIYEQYLASIRQAAQEAYNRKMENISNSYNSARSNLDSSLNSAKSQLKSSYDYSNNNINTDADDSLRQAYVNSMLQKKNLRQNMTAQGLSGGANESTLASLSNNYGNARTDVNTQRNKSLTDLEQTYNSNLAQATQQYNSALSNLDMQKMQLENAAEDALANYLTGYSANMAYIAPSNEAYISALTALNNKQSAFTFSPTSANNAYSLQNITQAQPVDASTNYAKILQQQALSGANSATLKKIAYTAIQNGANPQTLAQTLNMLGVA